MNSRPGVPEAYRQFFFVNAGGPSRKVVSREVVKRKWQLVTLDCSHRLLLPSYQKAVKIGCGFCGGLQPRSSGKVQQPHSGTAGKDGRHVQPIRAAPIRL
jgi:hypothetical protein